MIRKPRGQAGPEKGDESLFLERTARNLALARKRVAKKRCVPFLLARRSFTLTELMIVTAIITVLASSTMFALYGVIEQAKEKRTQAQVLKIHALIMQRWETYRSRKVPILIPPGASLRVRAAVRLHAIRDLMRMELPDRITDLQITPAPFPNPGPNAQTAFSSLVVRPPSLWQKYRRRVGFSRSLPPFNNWPTVTTTPSNWTTSHQQAECLYLILAAIRDGDSTALDYFKESEIADTDEDGLPEIVDAWGRPIQFLRWAPGFATTAGPDNEFANGPNPGWGVANKDDDGDGVIDNIEEIGWTGSDDRSELQDRNSEASPDNFDPLRRDPRWENPNVFHSPFMLYPLIFSAGPDGIYDIATEDNRGTLLGYPFTMHPFNSSKPYPNDPYVLLGELHIGKPWDVAQDGEVNSGDNITNHLQQAQ